MLAKGFVSWGVALSVIAGCFTRHCVLDPQSSKARIKYEIAGQARNDENTNFDTSLMTVRLLYRKPNNGVG